MTLILYICHCIYLPDVCSWSFVFILLRPSLGAIVFLLTLLERKRTVLFSDLLLFVYIFLIFYLLLFYCRLAYLHEGLEPKVVHRDVKSSNILLDRKWNAKVSDFGLAKLLGSEKSHVTTRVMGTFGFVPPTNFTVSLKKLKTLNSAQFYPRFINFHAHFGMIIQICLP